MTDEVWRPCGDWPHYEVSNTGKVRRIRAAGSKCPQRELGGQVSSYGYRRVWLCKSGAKPRPVTVHRLVVEAFIGPIEQGKQVNHINGVKLDNRAENLEIVTPKQNIAHAMETGLRTVRWAEESQGSKLRNSDVVKIRGMLASGISQSKIGDQFGVSQSTISFIARGVTWTTVTDGADEVRSARSGRRCNAKTKLDDASAESIRDRIASGVPQSAIAAEFGVSQGTVSNINRGRAWKPAETE